MGPKPDTSSSTSDIIPPSALDAAFRKVATTGDGCPGPSPFILTGGGIISPMTVARDPGCAVMVTWKYTPPKAPREDPARGITPSINISVQVYPPNPAAPAADPPPTCKTDVNATASAAYDRYMATSAMRTGWQQKPSALLDRDDLFSPLAVGDRICVQVPGRQLWWVQEEQNAGFLIWLSGGMGDSTSLGTFMDPVWGALRVAGNPKVAARDRDPSDPRG